MLAKLKAIANKFLGVYCEKENVEKPVKLFKPEKDHAVIVDGKIVDIVITELNGFTSEQHDFFLSTCRLLCEIINSDKFKERFLKKKFKETKGLSNQQLYNLIMKGMNGGEKVGDGVLDIIYTLYGDEDKRVKTIGYSYKTRNGIWTDRYFVNKWMGEKYGRSKLAGHIFHELMHQLGHGFSHKVHKGSFVYEAGYLVRDMVKEKIK